jgi:hypothetical protein
MLLGETGEVFLPIQTLTRPFKRGRQTRLEHAETNTTDDETA